MAKNENKKAKLVFTDTNFYYCEKWNLCYNLLVDIFKCDNFLPSSMSISGIYMALSRLDDEEEYFIQTHYLCGYSIEEIAFMKETSENLVKESISSSLLKLAKFRNDFSYLDKGKSIFTDHAKYSDSEIIGFTRIIDATSKHANLELFDCDIKKLKEDLNLLSELQYAVLENFYFFNLSKSKIAENLNISQYKVGTLERSALTFLASRVQDFRYKELQEEAIKKLMDEIFNKLPNEENFHISLLHLGVCEKSLIFHGIETLNDLVDLDPEIYPYFNTPNLKKLLALQEKTKTDKDLLLKQLNLKLLKANGPLENELTLKALNLDKRVYSALRRNFIYNVSDLLSTPETVLRKTRGIGNVSVKPILELQRKLWYNTL